MSAGAGVAAYHFPATDPDSPTERRVGMLSTQFALGSADIDAAGSSAGAVLVMPPGRPDHDEVAQVRMGQQVQAARALRQQRHRQQHRLMRLRQLRERQAAEEAARNRVLAPVLGEITSNYGARWGTTHYGLDIANDLGTPVRAPMAGTVIEAGPASGFGLWVRVRHDDGTVTVYGHINSYTVQQGQRVQAGQTLAEVGDRGISTGPHLHFEVWDPSGQKVDPLAWLRQRGVKIG